MAVIRTSLGMCAVCTEPPYPDGDCECAVDMRVCDRCGNGPLTKEGPDVCGPCEITQAAEDAGLYEEEDLRGIGPGADLCWFHGRELIPSVEYMICGECGHTWTKKAIEADAGRPFDEITFCPLCLHDF